MSHVTGSTFSASAWDECCESHEVEHDGIPLAREGTHHPPTVSRPRQPSIPPVAQTTAMADGLEPPETTHAFTSVPRSANGSGSPRRPSTNLPAERPSSLAAVHRTHQLTRPLPFFHPTRAEFRPLPSAKTEVLGEHGAPRWSSRASRKHRYTRHPLRVAQHQAGAVAAAQEPHIEEKLDAEKQIAVVEQRVRHSSTSIKLHPAWNLAFWVALVFVLGSTCWVSFRTPHAHISRLSAICLDMHADDVDIVDHQRLLPFSAPREQYG